MIDINTYIKTWAGKLELDESEIMGDFKKLYDEEKVKSPSMSEDDLQLTTLKKLHLTYKKQLRSPAVNFEGIIIAVGDVVDIVKKQRDEALKQFKENPQQAVTDGVVDESGNPIDTRATWKNGNANPRFNKPLPEHNFIRNIWGIAMKTKSKESVPRFFAMTINGSMAEKDDIPMFVPITFKAIDKSEKGELAIYNLNASQFTRIELSKTILPDVEEMINKYCGFMKVPINELVNYHEANKDNFNRLAIVTGDVSSLNLEISPTRANRIMVIEDLTLANLEDIESKGLTCWTPLRCNIDFQEESKVMVIGRTGRGKKRDEEGNQTEEPGDVTFNVYGVYAIPKYKVDIVIPVE